MRLIHVQNPAAFDMPLVRQLFERGFSKNFPSHPDIVIPELQRLTGDPHLGIFIVRDGMDMKGFVVLMAPGSPLFDAPHVYHFYNEGGSRHRELLVAAIVEWCRAMGHSAFYAASFSPEKKASKRDHAFPRLFKSAGSATRIGARYRFVLTA